MILRADSTGSSFLTSSPSAFWAIFACRATRADSATAPPGLLPDRLHPTMIPNPSNNEAIHQRMDNLLGPTTSHSRPAPLIIPTPRQGVLLSPHAGIMRSAGPQRCAAAR